MRKLRSDAKWLSLTPEQRAALEAWLFTEQIGFAEAFERAKQQFGFAGSLSSLKRFYHRPQPARPVTPSKESMQHVHALLQTMVEADFSSLKSA